MRKRKASDPADVILGSTALAAVDTALIMARTEHFRTIQTRQRYGQDLPECVLDFNEERRSATLDYWIPYPNSTNLSRSARQGVIRHGLKLSEGRCRRYPVINIPDKVIRISDSKPRTRRPLIDCRTFVLFRLTF
jgi:hypothetical protein